MQGYTPNIYRIWEHGGLYPQHVSHLGASVGIGFGLGDVVGLGFELGDVTCYCAGFRIG